MNKEIKVGDKVAIKRSYEIAVSGYSDTIPIGEVGIVTMVCDTTLVAYFREYHIVLTLPKHQVEPIQPTDRKTEFLSKLGALLREYDAHIEPEFNLYSDLALVNISIGGDYIVSTNNYITADNIMDFEKE